MMTQLTDSFAVQFRAWRRGFTAFTQGDIADITGATQSRVSGWESGACLPTRQQFKQLLTVIPEDMKTELINMWIESTTTP